MRMVRSFFVAFLFLIVTVSVSAQANPARDKFYNYFLDVYTQLSQGPLVNYFTNLNNTFEISFATENKLFVPALTEIANRYKISEEVAADSLFKYSINKLVAEKLWVTYGDVYKDYNRAFKAYSDAFCPCITEKYKPTDYLDKMMPILQQCVASIITDTAAITNIRLNAGDKTLNEIFRKQQYFSLYLYQNCDIVRQAFDQTLRQQAYGSYASTRSIEKGDRVTKALEYFKNKKLDSLAIIFPSFKKYTKELNEGLALSKEKNVKYSAYSLTEGNEMNAVLNFFNETTMLGDLMAGFESNGIYAPISKLTFTKQNEQMMKVTDKIEEIKEDTAVPVKQ